MRLSAPSVALLLFAIALAGCGGGGDEATTTSSTTAQRSTTAEQAKPSQEKPRPPSSNPTDPPHQQVPEGHPTPGSRAVAPGVPTTKGGDNSIQAFGTEGEEGSRAQAVSDLTAYLGARLKGEWARACSLASTEFREQLQQLIENAKAKDEAPKPKGCPETLELLTPEEAKAALRQRAQISEVLSFRVEGPYAYLIFKGDDGKVMFIAMADDGGQWLVNVLEPEAFAGA